MSDLKVAISWWPPQHAPGGRAQAIRGNVRGFLDAGHDVDVWWPSELHGADPEGFADYDLLIVPYIEEGYDVECHVHLQIGGYGDPNLDVRGPQAAVSNADSWSVLDPRLAYYFNEHADIVLDDCRVIPNAPNVDLFDRADPDRQTGHVLVPKIGGPYKDPVLLNEVANKSGDITYRAFAGVDPPSTANNVGLRPAVPLSDMSRYYAEATLVLNPAIREGLPNVAYESFLSGRAFVATPRGIGLLQTLPADVLEASDFGRPVEAFVERYHSAFYDGEHYHTAATAHLPNAIRHFMTEPEARRELAAKGHEWVSSLDYTWADKAELVAGLVD